MRLAPAGSRAATVHRTAVDLPIRAVVESIAYAPAIVIDLPNDEPFRRALREHVEFGSRVAMQNSNAKTDADLHPLREMPLWTWPAEATDGPAPTEGE